MMSTRKMIRMRRKLKYFCLGNQNTSHEENLSAQKCPFSCILQNPLSQCFDSVGRGQSCSRCIFLQPISNQFPGGEITINREKLGYRKKKSFLGALSCRDRHHRSLETLRHFFRMYNDGLLSFVFFQGRDAEMDEKYYKESQLNQKFCSRYEIAFHSEALPN